MFCMEWLSETRVIYENFVKEIIGHGDRVSDILNQKRIIYQEAPPLFLFFIKVFSNSKQIYENRSLE